MVQELNKKSSPTFSSSTTIEGFTEKETIALFQAGKIRSVENGEYVLRKDETCNILTFILDGSSKILFSENDGESFSVNIKKGSLFGDPDLSKDKKNRFSVVSSGASRILEIDQFAFNLLPPGIQISVYRKILDTFTELNDELVTKSGALSKKIESLVSYVKDFYNDNDQYARSIMIQDMIKNFPRLPIQINRLTSMLLDEGASVAEIAGFAKMDPSIVSIVLKIVNSGYYSFQRKISDFHHAFVLLGFNQVYQILMENFLQGVMPRHFNLKALNLHSAVISQIAFDIAQLSKKSKPVMMSTLGILHDLGKCVILVSKAKKPELDIVMARLDDCKVGSLLLDAWNTPVIIGQSVEYQKYPNFCSPEYIPENCIENVAILYIAHLCFDYLSGNEKAEFSNTYLQEYLNIVNLHNHSIESLMSQHIMPSLIKKMDVFPDYVRDFIINQQTTVTFSSNK